MSGVQERLHRRYHKIRSINVDVVGCYVKGGVVQGFYCRGNDAILYMFVQERYGEGSSVITVRMVTSRWECNIYAQSTVP